MLDYNPILDANDDPLFIQISRSIIADIVQGRLRPGGALPGTRTLAGQLGVHRNTVVSAYDTLASEGWVTTRRAGGTYVSGAMPDPTPRALPDNSVPRAAGFDMPPADATTDDSFTWQMVRQHSADTLFMAAGVPDVRLFPSMALARCYRHVLRRQANTVLSLGYAQGHPEVRRALADLLAVRRGMTATALNVQITRGTVMGLHLVADALIRPGDFVAVETPGYPAAWEVLRSAGARLIPVPVDAQGLDVACLDAAVQTQNIKAVFVTPHHQYPTTVVMSAGRRLQLLALAERHRFAIIEDDYDHAFHYEGQPVWPLASGDHAGVVIYMTSLSKLMAPGLRLGLIVAPQAFIDRLAVLRRRYEIQGDMTLELAIAELTDEGEIARHLRRSRRVYHRRRDVLVTALQREMPNVLEFEVPKGGLNLWVSLRGPVSMDAWADACAREKVVFYTTRRFTFDGQPGPSARLCFAVLNEAELEEAARRMARAYATLCAPAIQACGNFS